MARGPLPLSERLRPARIHFARPPYDAASLDPNAALAGRLSLSILSGRKFESIGRTKKIVTMFVSDSVRTLGNHGSRRSICSEPIIILGNRARRIPSPLKSTSCSDSLPSEWLLIY